jgi:hypothetical protein
MYGRYVDWAAGNFYSFNIVYTAVLETLKQGYDKQSKLVSIRPAKKLVVTIVKRYLGEHK